MKEEELKKRIEEIILKEFTSGTAAIAISDFIQENFVPKEKVKILLKEQHRNTRHDAVEAYYESGERDPDVLIMNLKQREPGF